VTAEAPEPQGPTEPPPGFQSLLGFELAEWRAGAAVVVLRADARHMNRGGAPHGGVLATLVDAAGGYAGCWCAHPGRVVSAQTLSLAVSFVGPARGALLRASGTVIGGGRRIFFARVEVTGEDGALVASGETSYAYRRGYEPPDGGALSDLAALRSD